MAYYFFLPTGIISADQAAVSFRFSNRFTSMYIYMPQRVPVMCRNRACAGSGSSSTHVSGSGIKVQADSNHLIQIETAGENVGA